MPGFPFACPGGTVSVPPQPATQRLLGVRAGFGVRVRQGIQRAPRGRSGGSGPHEPALRVGTEVRLAVSCGPGVRLGRPAASMPSGRLRRERGTDPLLEPPPGGRTEAPQTAEPGAGPGRRRGNSSRATPSFRCPCLLGLEFPLGPRGSSHHTGGIRINLRWPSGGQGRLDSLCRPCHEYTDTPSRASWACLAPDTALSAAIATRPWLPRAGVWGALQEGVPSANRVQLLVRQTLQGRG